MFNSTRPRNYNWLVRESAEARSKLNKQQRALWDTIEDKTLATIAVMKMDIADVHKALKEHKPLESSEVKSVYGDANGIYGNANGFKK